MTASLVVSWIAFAGAMAMLLRVAQLDLDGDQAEGAVLAGEPCFRSRSSSAAADADALFLLFALGAFWGSVSRSGSSADCAARCATATIPTGILILPALAWIGFRQLGREPFLGRRSRWLLAMPGSAPTSLYVLPGRPARRMGRRDEPWGFRSARRRGCRCSDSSRHCRRRERDERRRHADRAGDAFRSCGGG